MLRSPQVQLAQWHPEVPFRVMGVGDNSSSLLYGDICAGGGHRGGLAEPPLPRAPAVSQRRGQSHGQP